MYVYIRVYARVLCICTIDTHIHLIYKIFWKISILGSSNLYFNELLSFQACIRNRIGFLLDNYSNINVIQRNGVSRHVMILFLIFIVLRFLRNVIVTYVETKVIISVMIPGMIRIFFLGYRRESLKYNVLRLRVNENTGKSSRTIDI